MIGIVVGRNIYNVLFILGLSAVITPLAVAPQLIRLDVPVMIGCALAVLAMSFDRVLSRADGAILLVALVGYKAFVVRQSRREKLEVVKEYASEVNGVY